MMPRFRDDPQHPGTRVWQRSRWVTFGSGLALGFLALLAAGMSAVTLYMLSWPDIWASWGWLVVQVLVGFFMWAMVALVWRDFQGKRFARVAIDDAGISLDLPRNRSLIHRPAAFHGRFAWGEVLRIDTRQEAYLAQGMATLNRVFWLVRADSSRIFLFEERGIGTNLDQGNVDELVDEIARRGRLEINVLPVAEGKGGILSGWFAHPPPLDGAPLPEREIGRIRRRLIWTGTIGMVVFALVFLLQALG